MGIDIESEDADTIAGLIFWALRDLPKEGKRIEFESFAVVVNKMAGPRVLLVRVYPKILHHDLTTH